MLVKNIFFLLDSEDYISILISAILLSLLTLSVLKIFKYDFEYI